ncbi:DUF6799 domain-containing protein [Verrucomicrobiota bacterium sgz303538]
MALVSRDSSFAMRNFPLSVCSCILAGLAISANAQTAPSAVSSAAPATATTTQTTTQIAEVKTIAPDILVMSAGSILVVRGRQTSRLETEVRLSDGSILTPGGTVRRADGSSTTLADGQAITPAGKIGTAPAGTLTETTGTSVEIVPATKP